MIKQLATGALFLIVAACAQIPQAELAQYQTAFGAVEQASTDVLINFDQTLERSRVVVATRQQPQEGVQPINPYPIEFDEFLKKLENQQGKDIEVRRDALQVVSRYNAVLLQLAEGKSIDQVQTTTGELVTAIGKFVESAAGAAVPGLGAVVDLAKIFAGELEKARLQREFKKAIESGAPVVDKILDQFILDTADHYKLNAGLQQEDRILVLSAAVQQVGSLKRLFAGVGPPEGFASVDDRETEVNTLLVKARGELAGNYPFAFASGPASAPHYTAAIDSEVQLVEKEIARLAGVYQKNIDQVQALGELLAKYRTMLLTTKTALATLRKAIDQPVNVLDVADQLLDLSYGIERDLADLRAAVAAPHL